LNHVLYHLVLFKLLHLGCLFISEIVPILLSIAVITLIERRAMGSIQRRRGPNEHGTFGILQPIADGLKLLLKELVFTSNANAIIFILAPLCTLFFTLLFWCMIPCSQRFVLVDLQYVLFIFLIVGTFNVQTVIFAGWASNSKYAFLGGIRAASQMISYEICLGTIVASVILMSGSLSIIEIVHSQFDVWFFFPLFPVWVLFFITALAETNRTPFDLVEAEAELVAGYHVEYSAVFFALLFIAEYGNILIMSTMSTLFFFGGWINPFSSSISECIYAETHNLIYCYFIFAFKVSFHVFLFVLVRATVPRYRYDQLMNMGWKILLPLSISFLMLQSSFLYIFNVI
jgi:NADH-quinone oxidoreductase subunit H